MYDLVLDGNVYLPSGLKRCCVAVDDGKIVSIKKVLRGEKYIDVGDKLIIPGCIDVHVHFREPGYTYKEDFSTGTAASAHGGVTCCFDMPNTRPPTIDIETLDEKMSSAASKCHVDIGFWGGVKRIQDMKKISKYVVGFKYYSSPSTHYYKQHLSIESAVRNCKNLEKILAVHCEDVSRFLKIDAKNLREYCDYRSEEAESMCVERISKCEEIVHVCHISSPLSLNFSSKVSSECTLHHILLDYESFKLKDSFGKVNPPLRSQKTRNEIYKAFISGRIPIISSDHAPHTYDEKDVKFEDAPAGLPGVETCLPLLLMELKKGILGIERIINAYSSIPSKIFKINKGAIEVGRDGDLLVVDLRKETKIKGKNMHTKCGWSPYENKYAVFPRYVFVRGEMIVDGWEFVGCEGWGRNVRCLDDY